MKYVQFILRAKAINHSKHSVVADQNHDIVRRFTVVVVKLKCSHFGQLSSGNMS